MLDLLAEDLAAKVDPEGHGQAVKVPAHRSIGINALRARRHYTAECASRTRVCLRGVRDRAGMGLGLCVRRACECACACVSLRGPAGQRAIKFWDHDMNYHGWTGAAAAKAT